MTAATDTAPQVESPFGPVADGRVSTAELVRSFVVVFGGPAILSAAAAAAAVSAGRSLRRGRRPRLAAIAGVATAVVYAGVVVSWMNRWGATREELARSYPGDELVPGAGLQTTHGVTIDAPVSEVWPWLAQIGQDRGGFYSYEWLENLAGCRMRNADRIHPEWQHREVGEVVKLHHAYGLPVTRFEPPRVIALKQWGSFNVEPLPDGRTRVVARGRVARGLGVFFYVLLVEIPHFVMERRMLLGIKHRAESMPGTSR